MLLNFKESLFPSVSIYRGSTDTPLPTPSHRFNAWADDRRSLGITPLPSSGEGGGADGEVRFKNDREKEEWEEEQKVRVQSAHNLFMYIALR